MTAESGLLRPQTFDGVTVEVRWSVPDYWGDAEKADLRRTVIEWVGAFMAPRLHDVTVSGQADDASQ